MGADRLCEILNYARKHKFHKGTLKQQGEEVLKGILR
jgi:hypothetical protein